MYSDADIVLSKDWVPPITIAPTNISTSEGERSPARKKASSVSFSLDSSSDIDSTILALDNKEEQDKIENRKNKVTTFTHIVRRKVQNEKKFTHERNCIYILTDVETALLSTDLDRYFVR